MGQASAPYGTCSGKGALVTGKRTRWVHDAEVDQLVGECSGAPAVETRKAHAQGKAVGALLEREVEQLVGREFRCACLGICARSRAQNPHGYAAQ